MRLVAERSLSSILRSNLLTTLINDDVAEKPNARGARALWRNLTRRRRRLRLRRPARPSLYNIVPKREGATLLPYIDHSETSLGGMSWESLSRHQMRYVSDKPVKAVERCEFISSSVHLLFSGRKQLDCLGITYLTRRQSGAYSFGP